MLRFLFSILLSLSIIAAISFGSCNKDDEIQITEFQVFIDSILAPDTIQYGESFQVKFYGFLGETDCYIFQNFSVDMPEKLIVVSVIGGYTEDQDCDSAAQYLDGELLKIFDLPAGDYILQVSQPRDIPIEAPLHVLGD